MNDFKILLQEARGKSLTVVSTQPPSFNIALTAPYMHNGSVSGLIDVVEFYDEGGVVNEGAFAIDKAASSQFQEKEDLVQFLKSLTGSNVDVLVADAFAAPIGDLMKGDPSWVHGSEVEVQWMHQRNREKMPQMCVVCSSPLIPNTIGPRFSPNTRIISVGI